MTPAQFEQWMHHASKATWLDWHNIQARLSDEGLSQRAIAELASSTKGAVIGSQEGYRHALHCTDREILESYGTVLRKAIGSELRARSIIRYARSHGRLAEPGAEMVVEKRIRAEVLPPEMHEPATSKPETKPIQGDFFATESGCHLSTAKIA